MAQTVPPQQQGNRAGCWLTAFVSLFVALLLVTVGLFLPPFDLYNRLFTEPYATLSLQGDAISSPDQALTVAAATDVNGEFGLRLSSVGLQSFEAANAEAGEWIPAAKQAVPYYLALQSSVYTLETQGNAPDAVQINMRIPGNAATSDLLDMYGWFETETGGEWTFIPASTVDNNLQATIEDVPQHVAIFQAVPDLPQVQVSYDIDTALPAEVGGVATIVSPAGLQPTLSGTVTGSLAAGVDLNSSYRVMPVVRDFSDPRVVDPQTVVAIIGNSQLRAEHVRQLTLVTTGSGYDGLFIDYRGLPEDQRENFSRFIEELASSLDGVGRSLGVVVPAAQNVEGVWQTGAYDWRAIGAAADYLQIDMGTINPMLFGEGDTQYVEALLRWTVTEVNRYKVLLGLSSQSVREIAGNFNPIGYDEALAGLGNVTVESDQISETGTIQPGTEITASLDGRTAQGGVETTINTPYLDYLDDDGNLSARMWITTGNALRYRMDWVIPFALGGVAFDDLLQSEVASDVLTTIADFRTQIPTLATNPSWALRWRVVDASGTTVQEETTELDEELVLTLDAPDGNYAINPAVLLIEENTERESVRTGAQVALFQPTPTPTPLPTNTPTPVPTNTPTPAPIQSTPIPSTGGSGPSGGNLGANVPSAGSIVGGFEYGGHVTSAGSPRAISAMQSAGMSWMKVQIRYPQDASGTINAAHGAGFKILIGTVGNPNDLGAGGDGYIQQYASWLAGIAAAGADAIEVWNEPNIDREWPTGQISGAAFANLMAAAYPAIKNANAGTMVISGAPAPTGAEAAFPGQVVNDDNFLRQFVQAGGLNYTDCVGLHYNEGIVPPTQTSNDPRGDSYYTRFLQPMLNTYNSIVGRQRQLCITELGYLTSEGYPPLPDFFAWAQNVTLQQQAAWLAQAASIASQDGNVRLMIIWNVDFTLYGADPQGGYAIIRPDGSCPACQALAGAR